MSGRSKVSVRRRRRVGMVWLVVSAVLVGAVATLGALAGNTERVTRMWVGAEINKDGSARVTEVIDYDFGVGIEGRHGIYRDIPGLGYEDESKPHVAMDGGPVPYEITIPNNRDLWGEDVRSFRVGDPHDAVTGVHRYSVQYTLQNVAPGGKLAWDAIGTGWNVDVDNVQIHVVAPYDLADARCVQGTEGSQQRCALTKPGTGHLVADLGQLGAGKGATLYATRTGGTLTDRAAAPVPPSGPATGNDVGVGTLVPGLMATVITMLAALVTTLVMRLMGRERVTADGGDGREKRVDIQKLRRSLTPVPAPPAELTPAQGGILLAESVLPQHQVAWLMTTALDGHLDIDDNQHHPTLTRRTPADGGEVDPTVKDVFDRVFPGRDSVTLGTYDPWFRTGWVALQGHLDAWRRHSGLWDPVGVDRHFWAQVGGVVAAVVGVIAVVVGSVLSDNEVGPAWWVVLVSGAVAAGGGLAGAIRGWELEVRSSRGTALWIQVESFRRYLSDPAPQQVDEVAVAGRLDLYTAWAVALGVNDRWSQAMTDSTATATAARSARRAQGLSFFGPAVAVALITSAAASAVSPSSGGGGSGGSGGGGVGGGEGGGGGGSW
ncbi:DUF2207 domain-containing protein [Streptomyces sp. NPDC001292]|uniref:DUF2207 domain-containing protein n=1 Tax=Streptomyces sp. NPDC001292 TaxID=3364558 RepID=UPI0036935C07